MDVSGQRLEITYRNPADLVGYERNSKKHPAEQLRAIRRAMETFGNYAPILLRDDGKTIGAGHGRRDAALLKPAMAEVPTIVLDGLSEDDWRALTIWDNKSGLMGSFDADILRLELGSLTESGFDLSLTGFSSLELSGLFATVAGETDPDDEPEAPVVPVSALGDVWLMESHVLAVGDATDPTVVEKALRGSRPMLCLADPPYGTNYKSARRGTEFLVDGTNRSKGDVQNDHKADWREAWAQYGGDVLYVWHSPLAALEVQQGIEAAGFELRSQIIWRKVQPVVGPPKGHYRWQHEAAFYSVRKGKTGHWSGSHKESTVWEADRPKRNDSGHSTQKPVELWRKPIENHTMPGAHVFDPFAGSGVCTIACQMTKRIAHSIEIDPAHCDRHLLRFANFTGVQSTLAETGETFEQVRARRSEVV